MGPWPNARENDGYAYLLVVEDVFSRYAWVIPQRDLSAKSTWDAFASASHRSPQKLWCDEGTAFKGVFARHCASNGIQIYHVFGLHKAAMAERLNRTIGEALYRKMTEVNMKRWIDVLPAVVSEYNAKKAFCHRRRPARREARHVHETVQ